MNELPPAEKHRSQADQAKVPMFRGTTCEPAGGLVFFFQARVSINKINVKIQQVRCHKV